ncbi:MAG: YIP1 family protein [Gammaproteobacteria bacterium]|nr:YIP1 family protein [Gammaproteobacteria bacterium]
MRDLIDIFLQPAGVLARQQEQPRWLPPAALLVGVTMLVTWLYFDKVDAGWFTEQSVLRSGQELTAQQLAAIRESAGGGMIKWTASLGSAVGLGVSLLLYAVYFLLAGKVTGVSVSFSQGLALAGWSQMPLLLNSVLMFIGILGMSPQTPLEALSLTSLDALLLHLSVDSPWYGFANALSLLSIWTVFLAALGWKLWSKATRWHAALVVGLLPSLVVYGAMAISAMLK